MGANTKAKLGLELVEYPRKCTDVAVGRGGYPSTVYAHVRRNIFFSASLRLPPSVRSCTGKERKRNTHSAFTQRPSDGQPRVHCEHRVRV